MTRTAAILIIMVSVSFQSPAFARPDLEVTGIVYSDKPMAVVNNELLKEGDEIAGAKVEKIGEDFVTFKYGKETFTRRVGEKTLQSRAKSKIKEYKEKVMSTYDREEKGECDIEEKIVQQEEDLGLKDLVAAYKRAKEELKKVKERDAHARKAIKSKIDAVKGTGLDELISTHLGENEKDVW